MKEYPILFSPAMVRAIREGHKSQTRRIVKPQPIENDNGWFQWGYLYGAPKASAPRSCVWHAETWQATQRTAPIDIYCPYGQPGDRLWVRETWATLKEYDDLKPSAIPIYDRPPVVYYKADTGAYLLSKNRGKWRPGIFMPRWASRLMLEVAAVRVERLNDISAEDAVAEGILVGPSEGKRYAFSQLWDSINAKRGYGWDANPWVWVVEFKVEREQS